MTARILVVDDVLPNTKFLEARLTAEYFEVKTASNGFDALRLCAQGLCEIVLLDVMMPGMDGFEVCRRLKANPATAHIHVIMITALDQPADRVKGLEAGADDFLTKPVDELALIARVRSLARLKVVIDELRNRAATSANLGAVGVNASMSAEDGEGGHILLVEDRASSADRLMDCLSRHNHVNLETQPGESVFRAVNGAYDLIIISLGVQNFDALRLCSQLRSLERTRNVPVLILAEAEDRTRVLRGLDLGVNDYLMRPIDRNELLARVRIQLRRKRYSDRLRESVQESLQLAVIDALTGLNNRRYLEAHLAALMEAAAERNLPLSLMILDIDHFKSVNDTFGHDAGDDVLKAFALRVKSVIRGVDLLCRLGGEEFVIVMPETSLDVAERVAERVRESVGSTTFPIGTGAEHIPITVSIGLADRKQDHAPEKILKRADQALYLSKNNGRNRVSAHAA